MKDSVSQVEVKANGFFATLKKNPVTKKWQVQRMSNSPSPYELWSQARYKKYQDFLSIVKVELAKLD